MRAAESRSRTSFPLWAEPVALALIAVAAAALRFDEIGAESLWSDELATAHNIQNGLFSAEFWTEVREDVHPPGYFVLLRLWTLVAGSSEVALRAPSALAGPALCWALFTLARRRLGGAVALLAALLGALSPLLVQYGHEARSYALVCLAITWVAHAWWSLVEERASTPGSGFASVRAGLATAAAAYIHYSGLIAAGVIALLVALYATVRVRAATRRLVEAAAVAAVLYAPWVPALLDDLRKGGLAFLKPPDFSDALSFPLDVLPAITLLAALLCAALGVALSRNGSVPRGEGRPEVERPFVAFLLAWLVVTLTLFFVKSRISAPIFNVRNLIVVAPPIALLTAWAALAAVRPAPLLAAAAATIVGAATAYHVLFESAYYGHRSREDFREAAQCAIAFAAKAEGAPILALTYDRYFDYYFRQLSSDLTIAKSVSQSKRIADAAEEAWASGAERLIVIWAHIPLKKQDRKRILAGRALVEQQELSKAGCLLIARK